MVANVTQARTWALSSGNVEALKWFAFVAMLVDHVNTVMFDRSEAWMYAVGRIAMPVFAVVFGYNLARARDPFAVAKRLLIIGLIITPLVTVTINRGDPLPLNILFTFAAGASLWQLIDRGQWLASWVLATAAALMVDYSIVGVALVALSALYFQRRKPIYLAMLAGFALGLCAMNGNAWALVGFAVVAGAGWVTLNVPRLRWAFLAAYPGHLAVLWALRTFG